MEITCDNCGKETPTEEIEIFNGKKLSPQCAEEEKHFIYYQLEIENGLFNSRK